MTEFTRIISISILSILSFFCFQAGVFLSSGHQLKQNGRRTLIFIEFFTGFLLLFDALAYFFRGNTGAAGYYMVRLSNFLVFICNFSVSFFMCFYVCEFIKQTRLSVPDFTSKGIRKRRYPGSAFHSSYFVPSWNSAYCCQPVHRPVLLFWWKKSLPQNFVFFPLHRAGHFTCSYHSYTPYPEQKTPSDKCLCFPPPVFYSPNDSRNSDSCFLRLFLDKYFTGNRLPSPFLFFYKTDGTGILFGKQRTHNYKSGV